ncbi:MAG TPA: sigma-70 family RNA polymerase sigma factor [Candidatus Polarisedimenticolia bacterium]|jgi:RNA polymerase sigma-70 factor (ECF subfamily)
MSQTTNMFDPELAEAMIAGHPGAFETFAERHGALILSFSRRTCGEHAEEVMQETFLKAYQSIKDLREPAALKSWIYRIAVNECRKLRARDFRDKCIEVSLGDALKDAGGEGCADAFADSSEVPLDRLLQGELKQKLEDAILQLPDEFQVVLVLRDMEGLSTRETAEILEIGEPLVKVRLHRARLAVRDSLTQYVRAWSA